MSFGEYLQLLDWTGRQYRQDKRGAIPSGLAPILERLSLDSRRWLKLMREFRRKFRCAAGRPESLTKEGQKHGGGRMPGINHSRAIFGAGAVGTGTTGTGTIGSRNAPPPQSSV